MKSRTSTANVYRLDSTDDNDDVNDDQNRTRKVQFNPNNSDEHHIDIDIEQEQTNTELNRSFASDDTHENESKECEKNN